MNAQPASVTAIKGNQCLLDANRNEPPRYDMWEKNEKWRELRTRRLREDTPSLVHARNHADQCAYCGRAIAENEPVGLVHVAFDGFIGVAHIYAAVGFCCYTEGMNNPRTRYPARRQYAAKRSCANCGRDVWDARLALPKRAFCCTRCRDTFYRQLTLQKRESEKNSLFITCNTCGGAIRDKRRGDARFCSPACRQRAYRQRKQGAVQ